MVRRKRNINIPLAIIGGFNLLYLWLPFISIEGVDVSVRSIKTLLDMELEETGWLILILIMGIFIMINGVLMIVFSMLDIPIGEIITASVNLFFGLIGFVISVVLMLMARTFSDSGMIGMGSLLHFLASIAGVVLSIFWSRISQGMLHAYPDDSVQRQQNYFRQSSETATVPYMQTKTGAIECISGSKAGKSYDITNSGRITVGRDPNVCHITLSSEGISRQHCTISYDRTSGQYTVTDYSSNGTYAGSYRLQRGNAVQLSSGTILTLGATSEKIRLR